VTVERSDVAWWVQAYERAWRSPGTDHLNEIFADDASYLPSPWAAPIQGLDAIARFWEAERDGPDEPFTLTSEVVVADQTTAVVRLSVDYQTSTASRWRDLWVLQFDREGRCTRFEEWPFAPDQADGHGRQL
jgi:hypothetical protein